MDFCVHAFFWNRMLQFTIKIFDTGGNDALPPKIMKAPLSLLFDSTGFLFKGGSVWILLKWFKPLLKKTSYAFLKAHLLVDTTSRAILAVKLSKSPTHDIKMAEKVLKKVGKRRLRLVNRIFGDKAYTSRKLGQKLQVEYGIQLIVEPKRNAVDHGSNSWFDRSVRLYSRSASQWKHTPIVAILGILRKELKFLSKIPVNFQPVFVQSDEI